MFQAKCPVNTAFSRLEADTIYVGKRRSIFSAVYPKGMRRLVHCNDVFRRSIVLQRMRRRDMIAISLPLLISASKPDSDACVFEKAIKSDLHILHCIRNVFGDQFNAGFCKFNGLFG